jgi:hypothetical protein
MLSYSNILTLIDILPDYQLKQKNRFVKLTKEYIPHHGITCKNNIIYLTPSKQQIGTEYIISYDPSNGQLCNVASLGVNIRVKSLTFLSNGQIAVVINFKEKTSMADKAHTFHGAIKLYTSTFELIDSIDIPNTHFDNICNENCTFYATGANQHHGYIYKGVVENNRISSLHAYQVNDFPHGIDINEKKIAYTSYSTSGIHIIDKVSRCDNNDETIIYR